MEAIFPYEVSEVAYNLGVSKKSEVTKVSGVIEADQETSFIPGILPHGGRLEIRYREGAVDQILTEDLNPAIVMDPLALSDLELLGNGAFSPLKGFMTWADYTSVLKEMRLANGLVWSLPITLSVSSSLEKQLEIGKRAPLVDQSGEIYGTILVEDLYEVDLITEAETVFLTADPAHPGVARLLQRNSLYVGGEVEVFRRRTPDFPEHYYEPIETRRYFSEQGWKTIVGFQTRNPIHRAHEYIQKTTLETIDGLFIHPLVGETKHDDIPAPVRMKSYQALLEKYYPSERVLLATFPAAMRYAGPREAIFHALVRKNYGCTHFIVGRDHAGVGDYYGTYDAQQIFSRFKDEELGIIPLFFEHTFFCRICNGMASYKTCPHEIGERIMLSGTRVRELLKAGIAPPAEFSRKEVVDILMEWYTQS